MANPDVNYSSLTTDGGNPFIQYQQQSSSNSPTTRGTRGADEELCPTDSDNDDEPHGRGLKIEYVVPEPSKARWNHIQDLDSFFTRMYNYHQKHGYSCMMLQELFEIGQFIFVVCFMTFLFHFINYPVLFKDVQLKDQTKVTLSDVIYPWSDGITTISGFSWLLLSLAILFWLFRIIKVIGHSLQYWDVKNFFNIALKVQDHDLDNFTWHEIQQKIREVQKEQQMCIHKDELTELDIYHRILRFKNYMVAMMNKNLLPVKLVVPIFGEVVIFSNGLRFILEFILFRGPWSPFEDNWHIKEEYKRTNKRFELSQKLSRNIVWMALALLFLSPIIFMWNLMMYFFSYADLIKREPGALGARCWSQYGKLYMSHFNELEHEVNARLNRAYRPATKYMSSFTSPIMAIIAGNLNFVCGGIAAIIGILAVYDEDVLQVEHIFTIFSCLTVICIGTRCMIPDENLIWCPEQLMTAVLAHAHYLPTTWRGLAHTSRVREQFEQFFPFRSTYVLNELLSPFVIPYVLLFHVRTRSLDLVDFFRNFTVSVIGVGDVCAFAQMDVRKHGNPHWQPANSTTEVMPHPQAQPNLPPPPYDQHGGNVGGGAGGGGCVSGTATTVQIPPIEQTNQYKQGENGKTELSLMHFTLTNPKWEMPPDAQQFIRDIKRHAQQDMDPGRMGRSVNAMEQSLFSVGSLGGEYASIVQSVMQQKMMNQSQMGYSTMWPSIQQPQQLQQQQHNPFSPTPNLPHDIIGQSHSTGTATGGGGYGQQQLQQPNLGNLWYRGTDGTSTSTSQYQQPPHQQQQQRLPQSTSQNPPSSHHLLTDIQEDDDQSANLDRSFDYQTQGLSQGTSMIRNSSCLLPTSNSFNGSNVMSASLRKSRLEGPPEGSESGLLLRSFYNPVTLHDPQLQQQLKQTNELTAADMCLSSLYLHELHYQHIQRLRLGLPSDQRNQEQWQQPHQAPSPTTPSPSAAAATASSSSASSSQQHHRQQYLSTPSRSMASGSGETYNDTPASGSSNRNSPHQLTSLSSAVEKTPLLGSKKS